MDLELTGKTALITGASKGIGRAVAEVMAAEGCNVILVARDATAIAFLASPRASYISGTVLTIDAGAANRH